MGGGGGGGVVGDLGTRLQSGTVVSSPYTSTTFKILSALVQACIAAMHLFTFAVFLLSLVSGLILPTDPTNSSYTMVIAISTKSD